MSGTGARVDLERAIRGPLELLALVRELEVSGLLPDAPRPAAPACCDSCGSTGAHRMRVPGGVRCGSSWHAGACRCGGCAL